MKKLGIYLLYGGAFIFVGILIWSIFDSNKKSNLESNNTQNIKANILETQEVKPAEKIQVFLFHSTNRCYSCITAGKYMKETLDQNFSAELKAGKIEFSEINVDLPENKEVANKFKASGTSLFINSIIDSKDSIEEDTQIWRLVSNQKSFSDYISDKLRKIIGENSLTQAENNVKKDDIVFYFKDDCLGCENVKKYLEENDTRSKIGFEKKNVNKNKNDEEQMFEDAMYCNIDVDSFELPFLWANGKCYVGEGKITEFFERKINS